MLKINLLLALLFISANAFAELPISIGIDTKGGYNFSDKIMYIENEAIFEKEFDVLKGLTVGFENLFIFENPDLADEMTLGAGLGLLDFLSIGIASKLFISDSLSFGVNGIVVLGYEFEKIGLSIDDGNEFLYNFHKKSFEYVNTFSLEKMFEINDKAGIGFGIENELVVTKEEIVDGLLAGPKFNLNNFSFYANYALGIVPNISHGAEIGIGIEF